jgi:predicted RNase H-like HicB family nuclease
LPWHSRSVAKSRARKSQPRRSSRRPRASDFTAIIERDGDWYVALCPEFDIASQGDTVESARANLAEAVELFLETAAPSEVRRRLRTEVYVTRLAVARG